MKKNLDINNFEWDNISEKKEIQQSITKLRNQIQKLELSNALLSEEEFFGKQVALHKNNIKIKDLKEQIRLLGQKFSSL